MEGDKRRCRENVAFMVVTAMRVPDHLTMAEFRGGRDGAVPICSLIFVVGEGGLVKLGDHDRWGEDLGERIDGPNRGYERIARELVEELVKPSGARTSI